jgi:hypothetical protein
MSEIIDHNTSAGDHNISISRHTMQYYFAELTINGTVICGFLNNIFFFKNFAPFLA